MFYNSWRVIRESLGIVEHGLFTMIKPYNYGEAPSLTIINNN